MIVSSPEFIADAAVSAFGALGAMIVLRNLSDIVHSPPVQRSFRFCLWVLIVLLITRIGHWGDFGWLFSAITLAAASLIPLAALLLAEVMLRRHAPAVLKQLCAGGGALFAVLSFIPFGPFELWYSLSLMTFQLGGLLGVAWFTLSRNRSSLSLAENNTVSRIALSFLLILPFLLSDFMRTPMIDLPVRLGGVAVLALCWLSIGSRRSGLRKRDILFGFGGVVLMSLGLTLLLSIVAPLPLRALVQITAVLVAAIMLLAIWQASISLHIEDAPMVAMRAMARASGTGPEASLTLLRRAAGAPEAVLVEETELKELDIPTLRAEFSDLQLRSKTDADNSEAIQWLFSHFGATHVVPLAQTPLTLVMLNNPVIASADPNGDTLAAVSRAAVTMMMKDGQC